MVFGYLVLELQFYNDNLYFLFCVYEWVVVQMDKLIYLSELIYGKIGLVFYFYCFSNSLVKFKNLICSSIFIKGSKKN